MRRLNINHYYINRAAQLMDQIEELCNKTIHEIDSELAEQVNRAIYYDSPNLKHWVNQLAKKVEKISENY